MRITRSSAIFMSVAWMILATCLAAPQAAVGVPCAAQSDERVALVIGNSYSGADQISGVADAEGMADAFCELGFSVVGPVYNGTVDDMRTALSTFRSRIAHAKLAIFFFSGHGYEINKLNYLLPVGSTIDPAHPELPLEQVMWSLSGAPDDALKLVFLDACRTDQDLPIVGGGRLESVPGWSPGLAKHPASAPPNTAFGFAAAEGQAAASGMPDGFSPYSSALLQSIREPGLQVNQLLDRVREQVLAGTNNRQSPRVEYDKIPDYWLRPPVRVRIAIEKADDDLFVALGGKIVRSRRGDELAGNVTDDPLPLRAGDNDLVLLLYNQKSYHNGQTWERPEGWSYSVTIRQEDGSPVRTPAGQEILRFTDGEKVPFKDGPHHGQLFVVARANLHVNEQTAALTIEDPKTDVWEEVPLWATRQSLLYEKRVKDIPLGTINVFGFEVDPIQILEQLQRLSSGNADVDRLFAVVYGNPLFAQAVHTCMVDQEALRIQDLKHSIQAAFDRDPRPFDSFEQTLNRCVKKAVADTPGNQLKPDEIQVWTAFEDRRF
jgi:Caspase domain